MVSPLSRPLASLVALTAAALAACGEPSRPPVEIDWTFGGTDCQAAGVATIQIDVAGEILQPNRYSCAEADKGVNIGYYLRGTYTVTIQGFDANGDLAYRTTQDIRVQGSSLNVFNIDVPATGGSLTLLWQFAGKTCAQAGVSLVHVVLDGYDVTDANGNADLPCTTTAGDGTTIQPIAAGDHTVDLEGIKGGQVAYSLENITATIVEGHDTTLTPNLAPVSSTTATADVRWTFAGMSCVDAKVSTVRLSVNGGAYTEVPCSANGVDGVVLTNLNSGQSSFSIQGVRATNAGSVLAYQTSAPVTATFSTGLITQVQVPAVAASPGVGGAKLLWQFPGGGPVCSNTGSSTTVNYTIRSPSGQATSGQSTCGGASGNLGVEFCNPTSAGCPDPGLTAGYWTVSATATAGNTSYSVTGARFAVPNGDESTTNIALQ